MKLSPNETLVLRGAMRAGRNVYNSTVECREPGHGCVRLVTDQSCVECRLVNFAKIRNPNVLSVMAHIEQERRHAAQQAKGIFE